MSLVMRANAVRSREELAEFVMLLRRDLLAHPSTWENDSLDAFLEAIAAWLQDMDGYFDNAGLTVPTTPEWRTFAQILNAAKAYE